MCSLCGMLGGRRHWTESASNPNAFAHQSDRPTIRRERQQRTRLVNLVLAHYGLTLADWPPAKYILGNAKGGTHLVDNLGQLWPAADRLLNEACDPLDRSLLRALSASQGDGN
jgi:hypothetical protein